MVISRDLPCSPECLESAQKFKRTLLRTPETTVEFTSRTTGALSTLLSISFSID
ncbi:MAG: hypothetical protein RR292_02745 [Christensenellaceae bacterium]